MSHHIWKKTKNPFWNKFWKILRHNMHFKDYVHVYIHFFQVVNRLSQRQFLTYMMWQVTDGWVWVDLEVKSWSARHSSYPQIDRFLRLCEHKEMWDIERTCHGHKVLQCILLIDLKVTRKYNCHFKTDMCKKAQTQTGKVFIVTTLSPSTKIFMDRLYKCRDCKSRGRG